MLAMSRLFMKILLSVFVSEHTTHNWHIMVYQEQNIICTNINSTGVQQWDFYKFNQNVESLKDFKKKNGAYGTSTNDCSSTQTDSV